MTRIAYIDKRFNADQLRLIAISSKILEERSKEGYATTLRALHYQLVARNATPNTAQAYNRLGNLISDARLAGLISWEAIVDNLRFLSGVKTWDDPTHAVAKAREEYAVDLWANQHFRLEVWVEKDAIVPVVESVCAELRINFFACRGYASQTSMWEAGQRFQGYIQRGQRPLILHFGDHDPSGLDMTRDIRDRMTMFTGIDVQVIRLGLTIEQVQRYNLPPNFAKVTDSRFAAYQAEFGEESWELDALHPAVMRYLIESEVEKYRDARLWEAAVKQENDDKDTLDLVVANLGGSTPSAPMEEE